MGALSEHLNPSVKMICDKSSIAILSFTTHVSLPNYHFTQSLYLCGAVTKTMCIIDPIGDLYKCWNEIGMHTRSYGSIFGGNNRSNIDQWNNYQVASYEECRECAFLPVCMGGCPYRSISGGSKQCISVKYNYERLIRILAERVKKRNEKNTSIRN